jgi:fumarate hydratase class II
MAFVVVPADALWGAQTQRSIHNFPIAQDINKMPKEIIPASIRDIEKNGSC